MWILRANENEGLSCVSNILPEFHILILLCTITDSNRQVRCLLLCLDTHLWTFQSADLLSSSVWS